MIKCKLVLFPGKTGYNKFEKKQDQRSLTVKEV